MLRNNFTKDQEDLKSATVNKKFFTSGQNQHRSQISNHMPETTLSLSASRSINLAQKKIFNYEG